MLHLKDDFSAGRPISQVPASWFNKVAKFINGLIGGRFIRVVKNEGDIQIIDVTEDIQPTSHKLGEIVDKSDTETDDNNRTETWEWTVGGENGLKVDAYCLIQKVSGRPYASRCRLTISKDGIITKVEGLDGQRAL